MSGLLVTKTLSLRVADEIATLAVEAASINGFNPVTVYVLDTAGNTIVQKRMDDCPVSGTFKLI